MTEAFQAQQSVSSLATVVAVRGKTKTSTITRMSTMADASATSTTEINSSGSGSSSSSSSSSSRSSSSSATAFSTSITTSYLNSISASMPEQSADGIYILNSEEDYQLLLNGSPHKLVIVKFFSKYCRACASLKPKLIAVKKDEQLQGLPIIWAEFAATRKNQKLFQRLQVLTLPMIHFYDGYRGLVENFPCPPKRVPLLKKKIARFCNTRIDTETFRLKPYFKQKKHQATFKEGYTTPVNAIDHQQSLSSKTSTTGTYGTTIDNRDPVPTAASEESETIIEPRVKRTVIDNELITVEHIEYLRNGMLFFKDLTDQEFEVLLQKARLLTFDRGDIIIKQGMPGTTFYVVKTGVVEMYIKSKFDDPISTPSDYLGVEVNTFSKGGYFGERALTTGEPYAASFRVLEKVRCFAFAGADIPQSSILNKQRNANMDFIEQLNQRYVLPDNYESPSYPVTPREECILELLVRFKQIRQAAKCFDYIVESSPTWGNAGEIARRTLLVRKLSKSQRTEFSNVFDMVDTDKNGKITLTEMTLFMHSVRKAKTHDELMDMINRAHPQDHPNNNNAGTDSNQQQQAASISRDEFLGVIAEAEFFNLFKETFQELDVDNTGYIRAGDLDEVLGGIHDLIADKQHNNIIDKEDKDLLVDYEQFAKMLLGAAL